MCLLERLHSYEKCCKDLQYVFDRISPIELTICITLNSRVYAKKLFVNELYL